MNTSSPALPSSKKRLVDENITNTVDEPKPKRANTRVTKSTNKQLQQDKAPKNESTDGRRSTRSQRASALVETTNSKTKVPTSSDQAQDENPFIARPELPRLPTGISALDVLLGGRHLSFY